jgi:hypothetical protein
VPGGERGERTGRGADGTRASGRERRGRRQSVVARTSRCVEERHAARQIGGGGQDLGAAELPLLTHDTAGDVEAGEAQHDGLH